MARALQVFEVKPAYEDLAVPGATSLQAYLRRVHEMSVLAAIQVRQGLRDILLGIRAAGPCNQPAACSGAHGVQHGGARWS